MAAPSLGEQLASGVKAPVAAEPATIVIFGGAGDLAHRKLLPALYNLSLDGLLPPRFAIVGVGRRDFGHEGFRDFAKEGVKVAPSQVYFVLGGSRGKAKRKRAKARRTLATTNSNRWSKTGMADPVAILVDLKALAERAGGLASLRRLIEVLE